MPAARFSFLRPNATGRTGTVTLSLRLFDWNFGSDANWASRAAPSAMGVVYLIDGVAVTTPTAWPYIAECDSKAFLDGYHSLSIILVDAINPSQYRIIPRNVKFRNGRGVMTKLPSHGFSNRENNLFTPVADWLPIPTARPQQAPTPFSVVVAPPAHAGADPAKYRSAANWILEPLTGVPTELYEVTPSFYRDADGDAYIDRYQGFTQPELEKSMDRLWGIDFPDGPRNNNSISPYSSFAYDWNSQDIYGVDLIGRVFRIKPDGTVTTIFGPRGDPAVIPYRGATSWYSQRIGSVTDGTSPDLMCAIDIVQNRTKPHLWYLSDMDRKRIVELDVSGTVARMSTYVSDINWGAAMYVTPDNTMVVAEMGGTHDGHELPPGIAVIAPDKTIRRLDLSATGIVSPFCVRPTSDWKIIAADRNNHQVVEINPETNASRVIANTAKLGPGKAISLNSEQWTWIAVDRTGSIGPVDDIVFVEYSGGRNINAWRIGRFEPIANPPRTFWSSSGGYARVGPAQFVHDQMGHYPWAVAISERECRILFYGGGGNRVLSYRGRVATDPPASFDLAAFNLGRSVFQNGTINGFRPVRPTFTAIMNPQGCSRVGVPCFDTIAAWDDAKLAAWIQGGMGGSVARPEIVGYPLACLMYFIRRNSTQALRRLIPSPVKPADIVKPVVSDVVIAGDVIRWKTNEPTLGYVTFGSSTAYHRASAPGTVFGLAHEAKLEHPPASCHYSIRCTDQAGNIVYEPDRVLA